MATVLTPEELAAWTDAPVMDSFKIAGRGTIWIVKSPIKMDRYSPEIAGNVISHSGSLWRVSGIETRKPATPISIGEEIGLLVRPVSDLLALAYRAENGSGFDPDLDLDVIKRVLPGGVVLRHNPDTGQNEPATYYKLTTSVDSVLALTRQVALRETARVFRTGLEDLSRRFHWHITFPKPEQIDLLPRAALAVLLRHLDEDRKPDA